MLNFTGGTYIHNHRISPAKPKKTLRHQSAQAEHGLPARFQALVVNGAGPGCTKEGGLKLGNRGNT